MKSIKILIPSIILAIIVLVVFGLKKGRPDNIDNPNSQGVVDIIQTVNPTLVPVNEDTQLFQISGSYPQFPQADSVFNKKIMDTISANIAEFKKNAQDNYDAFKQVQGEGFQERFSQSDPYYYQMKTEIIQSTTAFVSVRVSYEGYTGGAHPFHGFVTYNYDVKNKKEVSLSDLFPGKQDYLKTVSDIAREQLTVVITEASELPTLNENLKSMLHDGTNPMKPENFQSFTFTDTAITIYFSEYQVAPYVFGEQKVTISR